MPEVRAVTVNDFEELLKCYAQIWENLREWLPDSFVDPELESIRKTESRERFKQRIESKDGIFLLAEEKNKIIGVALGREYGGVCNLGFLGVQKKHRREGVGTNLLSRFVREAKKRKAHKASSHISKPFASHRTIHQERIHTRGFSKKTYSWLRHDSLQ